MVRMGSEIVIYENGNIVLPLSFEEENFWLRQDEKSNVQEMYIAFEFGFCF